MELRGRRGFRRARDRGEQRKVYCRKFVMSYSVSSLILPVPSYHRGTQATHLTTHARLTHSSPASRTFGLRVRLATSGPWLRSLASLGPASTITFPRRRKPACPQAGARGNCLNMSSTFTQVAKVASIPDHLIKACCTFLSLRVTKRLSNTASGYCSDPRLSAPS